MDRPRITFGIIVLNGEPFTRHCIRSLYKFAHEIIVVEGASPMAKSIATPDGHSLDKTLSVLHEMQRDEDPENKIKIVTAEDVGYADGFWPGEKDEQSQAYAERASGDWLWQVDIDEFYLPSTMDSVFHLLSECPDVSGVSFSTITFFGDVDIVTDSCFLRSGAGEYRRLFRWGPGYKYASHRPPTVLDAHGRDLTSMNWVSAKTVFGRGAELLHYSLLFPKQVDEKMAYYDTLRLYDYRPVAWAMHSYARLEWPFRYHNVYLYPSWLERYEGAIPNEIIAMRDAAKLPQSEIKMRGSVDIQVLLSSKDYLLKRWFLTKLCHLSKLGRPGRLVSSLLQKIVVPSIPESGH